MLKQRNPVGSGTRAMGGGRGGEFTFATEDTEKYFDAFYSSMKSVLVHAEYHNVVKLTNKLIYELFRNF